MFGEGVLGGVEVGAVDGVVGVVGPVPVEAARWQVSVPLSRTVPSGATVVGVTVPVGAAVVSRGLVIFPTVLEVVLPAPAEMNCHS